MPQLTAFVARSFDPTVEQRIQPILDFLSTYRKAGFFWESAEPAEVESVSRKVQRLIHEKNVFIGFFTKRYPVYSVTSRLSGAFKILLGTFQPETWSTVPWVLQECGYAIAEGKHLILLRERGVEIPHLQGDLEYIPFDPENPALVFPKINEMINDLLARAAGRQVVETVSESPQTQIPIEQATAIVESSSGPGKSEEPDIVIHYIQLQEAVEDSDFSRMSDEWSAGTKLIASGVVNDLDQVLWDCHYFAGRFEAGAPDGLEKLRQLRLEHPDRPEPASAIATCLSNMKEYEEAARLFLEAAKLSKNDAKGRALISAANAFKELKQYERGRVAASNALLVATGDLRTEAVSVLCEILIARGDLHFAFATAEAALHENPQLTIRFKLGLDYHRYNFNELGLFHFRFCHQRNPKDTSSLHNLALMYADNKLPISAVDNYKKSAAMGETLSAANLGFMYQDAGMTEEAKVLVQGAMQAEPHDARVDKCWSEIVQRRTDEKTKETDLLKAASTGREFFIRMGEGFKVALPPIDGIWKFPFGEMSLFVYPGGIKGTAEVTRYESPFASLVSAVTASTAVRVDKYALEGKLTGLVCRFDLTVTEKNQPSWIVGASLLGGSGARSGFIVFAADGKSAIYAETTDRKIGKIENISKMGSGAGPV